MRWTELSDQACPVARGLSVVGDRWTMLILRDCFSGIRRFDQFQARLGITRHVLADRLKKLESAGVLKRVQYEARPPRHEYRLTEAGHELYPVLMSLITWAEAHVPPPEGANPPQFLSRTTGAPLRPRLVDETDGTPITARNVTVKAL
ncbi:MAG: winged helix-turn-helix transcriptional regulator [Pseudooceanicola sp.]